MITKEGGMIIGETDNGIFQIHLNAIIEKVGDFPNEELKQFCEFSLCNPKNGVQFISTGLIETPYIENIEGALDFYNDNIRMKFSSKVREFFK